MSTENPISPKVVASTAGAGAGALVSTLAIWSLGVLVWKQPGDAAAVNEAIAAVPTPIAAVITAGIALVGAAVPGWKVTDPNRVTTSQLKALKQRQES